MRRVSERLRTAANATIHYSSSKWGSCLKMRSCSPQPVPRVDPSPADHSLLRDALLHSLRCLRWREQMAQLLTGSPGGHFLMPPVMSLSGSATASPCRYAASRMHTECGTGFEPGQSRQSPDWTTDLMSTDMYYVIRKKRIRSLTARPSRS